MTNFTPMTPEAAQEWVDALEGPYADKKGKKQLCDVNGKMCCLGVLADMKKLWIEERSNTSSKQVKEFWDHVLPHSIARPLGLSDEAQTALIEINDDSDTFAPVIAKIKEMFIEGATS